MEWACLSNTDDDKQPMIRKGHHLLHPIKYDKVKQAMPFTDHDYFGITTDVTASFPFGWRDVKTTQGESTFFGHLLHEM